MPDNYLDDDGTPPKVINGRLTKPYPIRTRGDVNRARVLPPSVDEKAPPAYKRGLDLGMDVSRKQRKAAPAASDEQPAGVVDNIVKRRNLMKRMGIANRGGRRQSSRTARA